VTDARRRQIRLSRPYYRFAERLTARAGDRRLSDLSSLAGRRVGALTGSLAWDLLERAGALRIPYEGVEEPFRDLATGRLDAVLMDDIIADRYGNRPGLAPVGDVAQGEYAIGLRKEDGALADAIDAALERLQSSGELSRILRRWRLREPDQEQTPAVPGARRAEPGRPGSGHDDGPPPRARSGSLTFHHVALFWKGAAVTLLISASAMLIAISLGLGLALLRFDRLSPRRGWRRLLGGLATAYVELFRGTPVLLQLYLLYFGLAPIYPLHPLAAAILGLGLNYAAYEAEIYRAGLQAVPRGQIEAAQALSMSGRLVLRRVLLPQAFRVSLPGVANDFIALLKDSALVSVITVVELTKRMTIVAVDSGGWLAPGLLCATLYMLMSYPLSRLARRLERVLAPRS
jgi:polar amino acid transport system substrate-binding protein